MIVAVNLQKPPVSVTDAIRRSRYAMEREWLD
jgi:hypothetical protein